MVVVGREEVGSTPLRRKEGDQGMVLLGSLLDLVEVAVLLALLSLRKGEQREEQDHTPLGSFGIAPPSVVLAAAVGDRKIRACRSRLYDLSKGRGLCREGQACKGQPGGKPKGARLRCLGLSKGEQQWVGSRRQGHQLGAQRQELHLCFSDRLVSQETCSRHPRRQDPLLGFGSAKAKRSSPWKELAEGV